jgi:hypothetical protein
MPPACRTADPEANTGFQLAILGGCMTHQPSIPFNALYQRRLARVVQAQTGIRLRPHVARGFGLDFGQRLDALQERFELDGVLLHLRVMITKRARVVARVRTPDGPHWRLHPALLTRRHSGPAIEALRADETAGEDGAAEADVRAERQESRRGKWIGGSSLREVGSAIGAAAGLDRWAADDEIHRLAGFVADCERRKLPLFVLGPTPLVRQRWAAKSISRLNEAIERYCADIQLPHALIPATNDELGRPVVKGDGVHLTIDGHQYVADRLIASGFTDWVRRLAREPGGGQPMTR